MTKFIDEITEALAILEGNKDTSDHAPAMVVLPPDSDQFIIGNRSGLIHLAIAPLKLRKAKSSLSQNPIGFSKMTLTGASRAWNWTSMRICTFRKRFRELYK
jgi:hypothetical protein